MLLKYILQVNDFPCYLGMVGGLGYVVSGLSMVGGLGGMVGGLGGLGVIGGLGGMVRLLVFRQRPLDWFRVVGLALVPHISDVAGVSVGDLVGALLALLQDTNAKTTARKMAEGSTVAG